MPMCDWSSDVCSSDLQHGTQRSQVRAAYLQGRRAGARGPRGCPHFIRKLSGQLPLSPCSLSQGSLTSSAAAGSGQGERRLARLHSEKVIKIPGLPGVSKPTTSPAFSQPNRVSSSGLPTVPQPHPPRGRPSSVSETRQRLAAILRRRLSQQ